MPRWLLPWRRPAIVAAALASLAAAPAAKPPAAPVDGDWPRDLQTPARTVTVYQPQLESWDGHRLAVYTAIALKERPDSAPVFGVVWVDGPTVVDREARLVTFFDAQVRKVSFPSKPALDAPALQALRQKATTLTRTVALDRLTNLRVIEKPASPSGYSGELGPFPGWRSASTW